MSTRTKKTYRFTPESIQDELTDRIEQGYSNDQIVHAYGDDIGPDLRRWLNNRRRKLRKFWDSFPPSHMD